MVANKPSKPTSRDEFEIAIVCTRALEYDALCLLFDDFWDTDGDPFGRARGDLNTYTTGCMGNFDVVLVLLCSSGKASAASAAASLRSSYNCIELLLLAGICGGFPDANGEELWLGDVVISETVIEYDLGTQSPTSTFTRKNTIEGMHGRANKNIRNFTTSIKSERIYELLEDKVSLYLQQIQSRVSETKYQRRRKVASYMYPGSANDILFKSTHRHKHYSSSHHACADCSPDEDFLAICDQSRYLNCEQTGCKLESVKIRPRHPKNKFQSDVDSMSAQIPHVFLGRFGSGDTTFRSGTHRDSLAQEHNIIAFESEGAGVWDELPCIIVKGVSSYGDGHRSQKWGEWQHFAAATAASVTKALIERYPQTDKSPATKLKLQENKACLDALFITNPENDKERIEETKGGLLLDAYIWIIQNKEFIEWLKDPTTQLLWIKGDPGKGKTMLLCGIINELKKNSGRDIYYFLCQATDTRLNNSSAILRGLLHMILVRQPSLISHVRNEYDKAGKSAFEGANSWTILSRIFEQMLKDDLLKRPIFIIDALDECVTGSAQLLEMITRSSSSSRVKWLVSSRNHADIHEALAAAETKSIVSLELNAESVSTAITTYIRHKVRILSNKRGYRQPIRDDIENYLSRNANGTFLWVALVCNLLEKAPRSDPLPKSANFPTGLDELYERMINSVCALSTLDLGRRVLAIATVAQRPLTIGEFATLIENKYGEEDPVRERSQRLRYDWDDILGHCGSFLTMRNGTIYFIHQSAKDFLVKQASHRLFPNGPEYVHREIVEASLSALRNTLRKDIYRLGDPAFSTYNLSQRALSHDPLSSIRYSCVYWIDHFRNSKMNDKENIHDLIYTFLKEKYVYWLEALSLLKSIFDMVPGMQILEQLIADTEVSGLYELACDARRFIQTFGVAIADFPLQVYLSAMIFSPTRSIIRQLFGKEALEWVQKLPDVEAEWTSSPRAFESSGFSHIEWLSASCCGTWVAAMRDNETILIWQADSGRITQFLDALLLREKKKTHGYSRKGLCCFSPWSSEELASNVFEDPYVIIWDVVIGKALQQLYVGKNVSDISYLTSARDQLGCASEIDSQWQMVSVWNTKTGQMLKRTQLPINSGSYMLSPTTESKLAWSSWGSVKIFNLDTDNAIDILERGKRDMKFTSDGLLLAIKTSDDTVTLSDTASSKVRQTFKVATNIQDFASSPDGKLLAIATLDGIQIFSLTSGEYLQQIKTRSKCLIFSFDGNKIFSASGPVIHVADVARESLIAPALGDDSRGWPIRLCDQVHISPNCKLIVSVFHDQSIILRITDVDSRKFTHILINRDVYSAETFRMLFSPDSKKIVVVSGSMINLWDVSSRPGRLTLAQKTSTDDHWEEKMAFSPDSTRFATTLCKADASSTYMFTIKVWGAVSGKCLIHLGRREHQGVIGGICLCFSPDSKRLAISWLNKNDDNKTIRVEIWEIASNSAVQAINLQYCHLGNYVHISDLNPDFLRSTDEGFQRDGGGYMGTMRFIRRLAVATGLSFLGEGHLMLDLKFGKRELDHDTVNPVTDLRITLRTRTNLNLTNQTSSMIRLQEEEGEIYDIDIRRTWIEFNGTRLVWIPPQYRYVAQNSLRNFVAFSRDDGSPFVIQFRHGKLSTQTCLHELPGNWKFLYRDMKMPDDQLLEKIDLINDWVKEPLLVVGRNTVRDFGRSIRMNVTILSVLVGIAPVWALDQFC